MSLCSKLPVGSLFPNVRLRDLDIEPFKTTHYSSTVEGGNVVLRFRQAPRTDYAVLARAPIHYDTLIRRFVWHHEVMLRVWAAVAEEGYAGPKFTRDMERSMARNFYHSNDIIRRVAPALQEAVKATPQRNVRLFDIYMLEECYVGRHEPAAVVRWQMEHPEINLRCSDVLEADWGRSKKVIGRDWEGEVHRWNVGTLDNDIVERLVQQAHRLYQDWYDHPYAQFVNGERFYGGDVIGDLKHCDGDINDGDDDEDNSDSDT